MNTQTNRFGEIQTDWTSHKHPNNTEFMQVVKYMHIQKSDGISNLYWRLFNSSENDKHIISNISLSKAQELYVDEELNELTENDYQQWLKRN